MLSEVNRPPSQDPHFCTVCQRKVPEFESGPGGRPGVVCPHCGSLDRHRIMAIVAQMLIEKVPPGSLVLDIAPAGALSKLLHTTSGRPYVSIDFDPDADGRLVDAQASVTQLPIRTGSAGFILCSHVLEHVSDDRLAMAELARVLGSGSSALIQVPRRKGGPTDEDLTLTAEGRLERYGQADHVRLYGDDFEERLMNAGLQVTSTSYTRLVPAPFLSVIGITSDHELWVATTDRNPRPLVDSDSAIRLLSRSLLAAIPGDDSGVGGGIDELEDQLRQARSEATTWRSRYERLRNRPVVKAGSAIKGVMTGLLARAKRILP